MSVNMPRVRLTGVRSYRDRPPRPKKIKCRTDMKKTSITDNFMKRSWTILEDDSDDSSSVDTTQWDLYWASVSTVRTIFQDRSIRLRPGQKINHFPNHFELTRKDLMVKHCKQYRKDMEKKGLPCPEIVPITYYLPQDYGIFADECKRFPNWTWIVKPVGRAQGKGIFLVNKISQAKRFHPSNLRRNDARGGEDGAREEMFVVSRYIDRPLLVGGRKFDLRLYVLVTSFHPLIAYIHRSGFARFCAVDYHFSGGNREISNAVAAVQAARGAAATPVSYDYLARRNERKRQGEEYNNSILEQINAFTGDTMNDDERNIIVEGKRDNSNDIGNLDMHLTNVSLQKHHEDYSEVHGGKWPLHLLLLYLRTTRGERATERCLSRIRDLVYHSLRAVQHAMSSSESCFELYGYDVLLDDSLNPWLIEVNASPSLSSTTEADRQLKTSLMSDVFDIVMPQSVPYVRVRSRVDEPKCMPVDGTATVASATPSTNGTNISEARSTIMSHQDHSTAMANTMTSHQPHNTTMANTKNSDYTTTSSRAGHAMAATNSKPNASNLSDKTTIANMELQPSQEFTHEQSTIRQESTMISNSTTVTQAIPYIDTCLSVLHDPKTTEMDAYCNIFGEDARLDMNVRNSVCHKAVQTSNLATSDIHEASSTQRKNCRHKESSFDRVGTSHDSDATQSTTESKSIKKLQKSKGNKSKSRRKPPGPKKNRKKEDSSLEKSSSSEEELPNWNAGSYIYVPHRVNQFELLFDERRAQRKADVLTQANLPVEQIFRLRGPSEACGGLKTIRKGQQKSSHRVV